MKLAALILLGLCVCMLSACGGMLDRPSAEAWKRHPECHDSAPPKGAQLLVDTRAMEEAECVRQAEKTDAENRAQ